MGELRMGIIIRVSYYLFSTCKMIAIKTDLLIFIVRLG